MRESGDPGRMMTHERMVVDQLAVITEGRTKDQLLDQLRIMHQEEAFVYTDACHGNNFLKRFHQLYRKGSLCDVTLCVEGEELKAHRAVLAANSEYFEVMFTGSLVESQVETVQINSVSHATLLSLVEFCYTSSLKIDMENALELLSASNMFQFEGIKQCCSSFLETKLDAQNCLTMVSFAELHTCANLKENAEHFIRTNFRDVVKSDDFHQIELNQLKELLKDPSIVVRSERDVFDATVAWVQADEEHRLMHFPELLRLVRLTEMPPKLLVDHVENHKYVCNTLECLKEVIRVKSQHFLPSFRNLLPSAARLFEPKQHIYLIGGETKHHVYNSVDRYSLHTHEWSEMSHMTMPRDGLGVATYEGTVYAAGGYNGDKALNCLESFTPEENKWRTLAPMLNPRHAFSISELNGWIYAAGGSDFNSVEYSSAECYDPIRDEWYKIADMSSKREGLSLTSYDGLLYAMGGENGSSILNTVERYDPRAGRWYNSPSMGYRRRYFGSAVLNQRLYCIGGSDFDEDLNTVEMFEARSNRWIPLPSMNLRRESVACVAIDNRLFAIGGAYSNKETDSIEVYDPNVNRWEEFNRMPITKEGMGAVVL